MVDLFGNKIEENSTKNKKSKYGRYKEYHNYRKSDNNKKCKTCKHHQRWDYHNKIYHKCELMGVSNSSATDIRVSNVCDNYLEEICN